MTRKSEREIERAVDDLRAAADVDGDPVEFEITHTVVASDWTEDSELPAHPDADPGDVVKRRRRRIWRDETGEWHPEQLDQEDKDATK